MLLPKELRIKIAGIKSTKPIISGLSHCDECNCRVNSHCFSDLSHLKDHDVSIPYYLRTCSCTTTRKELEIKLKSSLKKIQKETIRELISSYKYVQPKEVEV